MANRTVAVALKAEIGSYVASMSKAAAATMSVGEAAQTSQATSSKHFDIAGKAGLAMGGLVVAGLGMAISKSMEFEKSMSAVSAATGASAASLGQLRDAAMEAGAATKYSATEAADAITEMAKAGVSTKDIMGGGLTGALSLAAAGQLDVADAAGIASVAMTQFSLSGKDIPHVADLLAAGAGKAMGSVDDLGQALNQAGLVAAGAGFSIEETTGTLAAFAAAGLIGSDAGTSMKTAIQRLQSATPQATQAMDDLGISVYDSNGNMISMAGIAGQLQEHLGGLTDEQRNAAMATIFGSDAVRAANVLYKEGSAGIEDWTKKVNDQGYAADQAAALNDNLSGDLERLGGAFDTMLITIGSGTQGPLRELVQMMGGVLDAATGLIGVLGGISGPVIAGTAAFAAMVALRGPLSAMFTQLSVSIMSSVTGLGMASGATTTFGLAAAGAKAAIGGLIGALAPLAAMIAATYAVKEVIDFVNAGDDATAVVRNLKSAIDDADGPAARFAAVQSGLDDLKKKAADAQAVIDEIDNKSFASKVFLSPFNGDTSALGDATEAIKTYKSEIADLETQEAQQEQNVQALADKYKISKDDVIAFADAHGVNLSGAMNTVVPLFTALTYATQVSGDTMINGKTAAEDFQTGLEDVATAASDSKKQIDLYKTSLDVLNGDHITAVQAEADFYAALAASDGALKNLKGSVLDASGALDVHSEAGRKTFDVLVGVKDSADQYIATLIEQGATSEQANAKDAELRDSFYQTALQMTGSKKAAEDLTNQIYGIPDSRTTQINADTKQATDAVSAAQQKIDDLHGATVKITAQYDSGGGLYLPLTSQRVASVYADGGYTGPGGKYQPAGVVHKGEVVFSQADVAAHGGPAAVDRLRTSRGYADGGIVGGPTVTIDGTEANDAALAAARVLLKSVGPAAGAGVQRWLPVVLQSLAMMGQPASLAQTVLRRMQQESGGNPQAINNWDSNAAKGTPSIGLMQTIGPTFRAYAMPGYSSNIFDPLSNLLASERYALARYGSLSAAYNKAGGYANGGTTPAGEPFWVGEQGPELMWSSKQQYVSTAAQSREFSGSPGGSVGGGSVVVKITGAELTGTFEIGGDGLGRIVNGHIGNAVATITRGLNSQGAYA